MSDHSTILIVDDEPSGRDGCQPRRDPDHHKVIVRGLEGVFPGERVVIEGVAECTATVLRVGSKVAVTLKK